MLLLGFGLQSTIRAAILQAFEVQFHLDLSWLLWLGLHPVAPTSPGQPGFGFRHVRTDQVDLSPDPFEQVFDLSDLLDGPF